jgi:UDP-3-O-[3-hydroxymyristoyl] glucosamine N-acyltransferase
MPFIIKKRAEGYDQLLRWKSCYSMIGNWSPCTIDKGVTGDTTIGEGTKIDNQVHVGHDTVIGKMFDSFTNRNCGLCYY